MSFCIRNPLLDSVTVDDLARLVGERLRAARHERGLSLAALADAAGIGKGSLSEIENGARNPTLSTLYALAGTLGVPLATLLADRAGARISSPASRRGCSTSAATTARSSRSTGCGSTPAPGTARPPTAPASPSTSW